MIEVTTDEAVGVALSLGRQVYVSEDIWEGARVSLYMGRSRMCRVLAHDIEIPLSDGEGAGGGVQTRSPILQGSRLCCPR